MKKIFTALALVFAAMFVAVCVSAYVKTGNTSPRISVYSPDGAPALGISYLLAGKEKFENFNTEYHVVDPLVIQTYVSGRNPAADVCVLPVNLAVKLLGNGERYRLLGTLTHGNLYLLSKENKIITPNNISDLKDKTVGVANLAQVPGLTVKLILKEYGLTDSVKHMAITAQEVGLRDDIDYFVVPEPAASAKVNAVKDLEFSGDIQALYGGEVGYPQAVVVAKRELGGAFLDEFTSALEKSGDWITDESTSIQEIAEAVKSHLAPGMQPALTVQNLSLSVIKNCSVNFVRADACKEEIKQFIEKLNGVSENSFGSPSDKFFSGYKTN